MRKIYTNNVGSMQPVTLAIMIVLVSGLLVLIFGEILLPFFNLGRATDTSIDSEVSEPRGYVNQFVDIFWARGLLFAILLIVSIALIREYQKDKYHRGG